VCYVGRPKLIWCDKIDKKENKTYFYNFPFFLNPRLEIEQYVIMQKSFYYALFVKKLKAIIFWKNLYAPCLLT